MGYKLLKNGDISYGNADRCHETSDTSVTSMECRDLEGMLTLFIYIFREINLFIT